MALTVSNGILVPRMTTAAVTATVFVFVQAISFNAPFMIVNVEPLPAAALASAMAVAALTSVAGAICMEWAEIADVSSSSE